MCYGRRSQRKTIEGGLGEEGLMEIRTQYSLCSCNMRAQNTQTEYEIISIRHTLIFIIPDFVCRFTAGVEFLLIRTLNMYPMYVSYFCKIKQWLSLEQCVGSRDIL